jgi:hypothetical protein
LLDFKDYHSDHSDLKQHVKQFEDMSSTLSATPQHLISTSPSPSSLRHTPEPPPAADMAEDSNLRKLLESLLKEKKKIKLKASELGYF